LPKSELNSLLDKLSKLGQIVAPTKDKDIWRYKEIEDYKEIDLNGLPWFSAKTFLFPKKHTLFEYKADKIQCKDSVKPIVLFGARLCDLNSFYINDKLFLDEFEDPFYKARRESIFLVGFYCNEWFDEYCLCASVKLKHYYDIMLVDLDDKFFIISKSDKGKELIKDYEDYEHDLKEIQNHRELQKKDLWKFHESKDWEKGSSKCLSCGHCTNLCPTCLCFDIYDSPDLDMKSGKRNLEWDSCQYKDFTLVAGGHTFRETRDNRFKHRIFHKLQYFKDEFNEYMCVGCGRCTRGCPKKIDWVKIVNELGE